MPLQLDAIPASQEAYCHSHFLVSLLRLLVPWHRDARHPIQRFGRMSGIAHDGAPYGAKGKPWTFNCLGRPAYSCSSRGKAIRKDADPSIDTLTTEDWHIVGIASVHCSILFPKLLHLAFVGVLADASPPPYFLLAAAGDKPLFGGSRSGHAICVSPIRALSSQPS